MAKVLKPKDIKQLSLAELGRRRRAIKARIEWLEKRDRQIAAEMSRRVQGRGI